MTKINFTSGIILSGGKSQRMNYPKAMLSWGDSILINYQIISLFNAGCSEVVVVTGKDHEVISKNIIKYNNLKLVYNSSYEKGKTTSIKSGLEKVSDISDTIMIIAVDQPRPPHIIKKLIEFHNNNNFDITYPIYKKRGGHPLIFAKKMLPELLKISENKKGIREIFNNQNFTHGKLDFASMIVRVDINTIEDYERAKLDFDNIEEISIE